MFKDQRTLAAHWSNGISQHEIQILFSALRFMDQVGSKDQALWWATIGDDLLNLDYANRLVAVAEAQKTITKYQKRWNIRPHRITLHELFPSLHSNILFLATPRLADRVHELHLTYMQGDQSMQRVTDVVGVVGYLTKERTPEADRSNVMRMIKQAHTRNGQSLAGRQPVTPREIRPFIGDRVTLSSGLKKDLISRNVIDPFKATNWNRKGLVGYTGKGWELPIPGPETKPIEIGQLDFFPEHLKPPARLRQHVSGILSPSASSELEFRRKQAGLTQRELGARAGLSQSQIANAVSGRFGLSKLATERLQQALAA